MSQTDAKRKSSKKSGNSSRARYLKQRANSNALITGPGMFFTCPRGKEAASVFEFRDLLERVAEEIKPAVAEEDQVEISKDHEDELSKQKESMDRMEPQSIDEQIQRELEELTGRPAGASQKSKNTSNRRRFESKNIECECLGFISFPKDYDPVEFATHIVEQIKQGKSGYGLRFIQRITPVSMTCSAVSPVEFEKIVTRALSPRFGVKCYPEGNESGGQTALATPRMGLKFRIEPIIRCHDKPLNRSEVIRITGDVVRRFNGDEYVVVPDECSVGHDISQVQHRVSIDNAQVVILISVYRYVAGVSVVEGYDKEGKKFNLRVLAETQEKKMNVG